MTAADNYTDGLNWTLTDLNGDGGPDLVMLWQDEYVREPVELDDLGGTAWAVYLSTCE